MSNDRAKGRKVPGFYLTRAGRVALACILVAVAIWPVGIQPQATQAAPVYAPQTPTLSAPPMPTPTPLAGEDAMDQAPQTPSSPDNLPPATPTSVPRPMQPLATPAVPLAATAMPPSEEGPSEPSEPALGPVPLGPEQARQAALSRMRTQVNQGCAPAWDGATLGDSIPLYDLSGEITAYLFPVSNGGTLAGYLTVAALQLPNPVLEFSTGGSTPLHGALDQHTGC